MPRDANQRPPAPVWRLSLPTLASLRKWWVMLWLAGGTSAEAATFQETFCTDPSLNGWQTFGDSSLYQWNRTNQDLEVTWDSSRTNSFFFRRLDTIVTGSEDFSFSFVLRLHDIRVGSTAGKSNEFEIAIGLLNYASATNSHAFRGTGQSATYGVHNLVEFDYFPDAGFGDTFATTVVTTNNRIYPVHNFPLTLTTGDRFRITLTYCASYQVVHTIVTRNGAAFGLPPNNSLGDLSLSGTPDFRVDSFAVISYSDAVQAGPLSVQGSVLAHGTIDDVQWSVSDPPIGDWQLLRSNAIWRVELVGLTNWAYTLERATNLSAWLPTSATAAGNGTAVSLVDTNPPDATVFYRIRAERP